MEAVTTSSGEQSRAGGLLRRVRELYARRETILFLTSSNLKAGHRDKLLGRLWSVLDPLMFMLVYYFVFGVLFGLARPGSGRSLEFMLYILIAVLMWRFIEATVSQSANTIRASRGLIHEINFPKAIFPVSVALSRMYDFLWGLVVMVAFLLIAGVWPTVHYLWLPLLLLLTLLFVMGVGFIVAYLGAFFADTTNVVSVAMRLMFYCSPIFYYVRDKGNPNPGFVILRDHPTAWKIYMLNPIACYFECYRDALLWGTVPEMSFLLYVAIVSVITCLVGFVIFSHGEGKFAKYI